MLNFNACVARPLQVTHVTIHMYNLLVFQKEQEVEHSAIWDAEYLNLASVWNVRKF